LNELLDARLLAKRRNGKPPMNRLLSSEAIKAKPTRNEANTRRRYAMRKLAGAISESLMHASCAQDQP
jgi:hypothetical protein